jgi:polyphosphate glucokinase
MDHPLGIDFGGTGIKGAPVDLEKGDFAHDRVRIDTPRPADPQAVATVFQQIVDSFPTSSSPVGVTVPGIVRRGVVLSAANIDKSWIGEDADAIFTEALSREVHVVNDADAAGLAEAEYGAAKGRNGLVMVITLGTGIGSAMIWDGELVPNSEMGHLELDGAVAEVTTATSAREREGLTWEAWSERLTKYFRHLERLFTPDLFVIGGGVSKSWDKFGHLIEVETEMVPATLQNRAGIVGAALVAHRKAGQDD